MVIDTIRDAVATGCKYHGIRSHHSVRELLDGDGGEIAVNEFNALSSQCPSPSLMTNTRALRRPVEQPMQPGYYGGERHRRSAALLRMMCDSLSDVQRLGPPFHLLHSFVASSRTRSRGRRRIRRVLTGEHASRNWAVRHDAQSVRSLGKRKAELGGNQPVIAARRNGTADDLFRAAGRDTRRRYR